jgi:hypothetical protein
MAVIVGPDWVEASNGVRIMRCSTHHTEASSEPKGRARALALAIALAFALTVLSGWLLSRPLPAEAQEAQACDVPGTVRIQPTEADVDVGRTVTVEVWLEDAGNYYGLDIRLAFDPALVRVPSGRVTPRWEVFDSANHFAIKNEANNISGTVWYAVTNISPAEPFTGTGRICAIAFTGVASGTTPLHFTYAKGSTRSGLGLYPTMLDGEIAVRGAQQRAVYLPLVVRSAAVP